MKQKFFTVKVDSHRVTIFTNKVTIKVAKDKYGMDCTRREYDISLNHSDRLGKFVMKCNRVALNGFIGIYEEARPLFVKRNNF